MDDGGRVLTVWCNYLAPTILLCDAVRDEQQGVQRRVHGPRHPAHVHV